MDFAMCLDTAVKKVLSRNKNNVNRIIFILGRMVGELASLVKKKDHSKCLILSVEEVLVDYLEGNTSLDGAIELVPMGPFDRMLVHRLADIFGFSHHSVGEGHIKHMVLERNPETSIPDTLLSRYLWKTRALEIKESPEIYDVVMKKEVSPGLKVDGHALGQADKGTKRQLTSRDTQGQVYELADLVKNNHASKSLILSVEERLVEYLGDDTSSNGLIELIPMDPFNRMLVHRLADIFGFSSHSVGEEKDRHVVLERCSETSIPDLLVSRLLWKTRKWETLQMPTTCDVLMKKEVLPDDAKIDVTDDEKDTNSSKKMKVTQTMACTMMPGDEIAGEEVPMVDGSSPKTQREDHSDALAELLPDEAKVDTTDDEADTNSSKKMKVTQTIAITTMPEDEKAGEEVPMVDARSREAQRDDHSDGLAELKKDTPNSFLKL